MLGESSRMLGKATDALLELAKMPLLKRFLLGAAHILRNAQGGAEVPPPPPPPESRICLTQDECGHALNALLDLVPLTVKLENDIKQEDYLLAAKNSASSSCEHSNMLCEHSMFHTR
jgi:hypothetical protein